MQVTLARAASGVATKRHRLGPAGEVVTEGYPQGESRWALYRRDLPDLPALAGRTVRVTTGVTVDARDGTRREIVVRVQPSPLDRVEQVIG